MLPNPAVMPMDKHKQGNAGELFRHLCKSFEVDPTLENYVALRRAFAGGDTEIHRFVGVDPFQALGQEVERTGRDRGVVAGALGGDNRDIDELCLQLMERLIDRRRLEASGETHLHGRGVGISDALVAHLIVAMMEVLQQDGSAPGASLVQLIRERLGAATTEIFKSHTKWGDRNRALFLAMQMKRRGEKPTIRKIARTLGVQPSTVSRWFPDGDFLERNPISMHRIPRR